MAEAKLTITTNAQQVVGELEQISEGLKDLNKNQKYVFDNAEVIAKQYGKTAEEIRKAEQAQQKLASTTERALTREKGLVEDIEDTIKKWQEAWRKATDTKDIEKYNQKIEEAKIQLEEYKQAGLKAEKQTESLSKSFSKWITGVASAAVILKKLKDAFLETTGGINLFNNVTAATTALLNDIVTTGTISIATIRQAIATQQVLNDLRLQESIEGVKISKLNIKYQKNYIDALDQTLSREDQLLAIDAALEAHNEKIDLQVGTLIKQRDALRDLIDKTLIPSEKTVLQYAKVIETINNLEAERDTNTKRLQSKRSGIIQEDIEKQIKWRKDLHNNLNELLDGYNKEQLEKQKQYQELALKLLDEYDKSQIDSLEGKEKLIAQRNFGIKQLKEFRDQLAALGTLTNEQKIILQVMAENIWKEYYKALAEETKDTRPTEEQQKAISKALLGDFPELQGLIKKDVDAARKEIDEIINANKAMEPFSFWRILGLDPEDPEDSNFIAAFENAARTIGNIIDDIYDKRVDDAQRRRELLDTQIAETQRSLDLELALYEDGYANNIDAKKKEVAELQKQRAEALKNEEKAIKAQRALETVTQTMNLITASSQLLSWAKDPITLAIAIGSIAVMFGAFAAAKLKATKATKLAEGGYGDETGVIRGRSHAQGGEKFLDHVEVEKGEAWGVLSRPASQKYGEIFHDMVSSFNKDQMPAFMPIANTVNVDNKGPNSRLDKVITEQRKLNQSILSQSQISHIGNKKIIKTGNKVRIVG